MSNLISLNNLEKAKILIYEAKTIGDVKQIKDQSEALIHYAKQQRYAIAIQNDITEINITAKRKLGEISLELDKKQGVRSTLLQRETKSAILESHGISRREAFDSEKIAKIPENTFNKFIKTAKETGELTTKDTVSFAKKIIRPIITKEEKERSKKRVKEYFEQKKREADRKKIEHEKQKENYKTENNQIINQIIKQEEQYKKLKLENGFYDSMQKDIFAFIDNYLKSINPSRSRLEAIHNLMKYLRTEANKIQSGNLKY